MKPAESTPRWAAWLLCVAAASDASAQQHSPVAFAFRAEQPVVVDGVLAERFWRRAVPLDSFVRIYDNTSLAEVQTTFKVVYNARMLYFGIEADEPNVSKLVIRKTGHDAWPPGSSVELFLDPNRDRHSYYQLAANLAGSRYDGYMKDRKGWNADWQVVARVGKRGWTMEIGIPFSAFGLSAPERGSAWGLNVCRNREGGLQNSSSWARVGGDFANPGKFNTLLFGNALDYIKRELAYGNRISDEVHQYLATAKMLEPALQRKLEHADKLGEALSRAVKNLPRQDIAAFLPVYDQAQNVRRSYGAIAEEFEVLKALEEVDKTKEDP